MIARIALIAAALALSACDRAQEQTATGAAAPQLDAPAPDSVPSRVFAPTNDAARIATGNLTMTVALSLPDAGEQGAGAQETLALSGANGLSLEAAVTSAVSPATQVQGQTLRALMSLPVEEPQTLVYRVARQSRPESGAGICGGEEPAFVVVWEPSSLVGDALKVMGVMGGAPGAAGARPCPMLEYRRS